MAALLAALGLPGAAGAAGAAGDGEPAAAPPGPALELRSGSWSARLGGEARLLTTYLTELEPMDPDQNPLEDTTQDDSLWWESRVRLRPVLGWDADLGPLDRVRLHAEVDLVDGVFTGDEVPARAVRDEGVDAAELRHLWLGLELGRLHVRAGRMGSRWGLGIVANDGDPGEVPGETVFGDPRHGDVVDRLMVLHVPDASAALPLVLSAAVDRVVEDGLTDDGYDDEAWNFVAAALVPGDEARLGLYGVYRIQESARQSDTRIGALDLFVDLRRDDWFLTAEATVGLGESELARTPDSPEVAAVLQHGAALRAGLDAERLVLTLDAGYASGDDNPFDDELRGFHFDPDFDVGLILFEEYLGALTAASEHNLGDPALVGSPPPGAPVVGTDGGVTNAVYLHPRATVRSGREEGWELVLGLVWARALVDVVDPFQSFVSGGQLVNHLGGEPGEKDLGLEVDGSLAYRASLAGWHLTGGVQGGAFWPGAAFRDAAGEDPDPVTLVQGRMTASW